MRRAHLYLAASLLILSLSSFQTLAADPVPVEYDTVKTHPEMYIDGGTPEGECIGLAVSNHGEMGQAGLGGVNLDYLESGLECGTRPEDGVYLYSGSPFVIVADDADGTNARLTCSYADTDGSKHYAWVPTGEGGAIDLSFGYCILAEPTLTGRFISADGTIMMENVYYPPSEHAGDARFVIVESKFYPADGYGHDHVTAGCVVDWDIPSDIAGVNTSGVSLSDFVYLQGTDTAGSEACQSNARRYATLAYGGGATSADYQAERCANHLDNWGSLAASQRLLQDTSLARDGVTVIDPPQPDARAWWEDLGANPGNHAVASEGNQAVWLTYLHDYDLGPTDTVRVWSVLATVRNGSAHDLEPVVSSAYSWVMFHLRQCHCACCVCRLGNANGLGPDEPTIGDVSTMIDARFIAGTCEGIITCIEEANINQSGFGSCEDITISDISILIDYLFISGPENVELPYCW